MPHDDADRPAPGWCLTSTLRSAVAMNYDPIDVFDPATGLTTDVETFGVGRTRRRDDARPLRVPEEQGLDTGEWATAVEGPGYYEGLKHIADLTLALVLLVLTFPVTALAMLLV